MGQNIETASTTETLSGGETISATVRSDVGAKKVQAVVEYDIGNTAQSKDDYTIQFEVITPHGKVVTQNEEKEAIGNHIVDAMPEKTIVTVTNESNKSGTFTLLVTSHK